MNFNHLKYFYDATAAGSVGKAAIKNFVSQSAISQAIRKLEEALDCQLLIHKKNSFQLTDEGRTVFQKCQDIFNSVQNLKNEVKLSKTEISGTLTFATSHSIALSLFPDFLKLFKKNYPLVSPRLRLGKTPLVRRWVEDREVDFGITVDDDNLKSLEKTLLKRGQFVATSQTSRYSNEQEFIITESRPETIALKKHFLRKTKNDLPVLMEVDSWEIINQFAQKGIGIGYVPDFVLKANKILIHPSIPKINYDLLVIQNKGQRPSKVGSLFISDLIQFLNKA